MNRLKDYFHFQKEEKIGFFILVFIIVGVIVYINFDERMKQKTHDYSEFEEKIEVFEAVASENYTSLNINKNKIPPKAEDKAIIEEYTLFTFDPNGLSLENWKKLGLSEAQAEVIKNYENKGGRFYNKNDVKKMYSISDQKYKELEPYIKIDQNQFQPIEKESQEWERIYMEEEEALYLDLNIADSLTLLRLNGIGPAFTSRIIELRNKLGGFSSKKQLLDVWGMDSARFNKVKESVFVDRRFKINKININTATAEKMKDHPYISWNVANSIEKYREQNGTYKALEEIKNSHLINDSLYNKLSPYLKLE